MLGFDFTEGKISEDVTAGPSDLDSHASTCFGREEPEFTNRQRNGFTISIPSILLPA